MTYSLDTSALLDARIRYYPPDVFPNLWERIDELIRKEGLIATEEVLRELERRDDEVHAWASERREMFVAIDEEIQPYVADIMRDHPKLIDQRAGRYAADPFVIALAQMRECTVVTGEKPTGTLARPNIPDVCDSLGVPWMNMLQLIRAERWVFE